MQRLADIIRNWGENIKKEFLENKYLILLSFLFFVISNIILYFASNYVDKVQTAVVPDLILDHIPVINLSFIFVYVFLALVAFIFIYFIFIRVKDFHKAFAQFGLLILVRSFFIVLTHLERPANAISLTGFPKIYHFLSFYNDLFFSGHVAIPFMAFLLFKKEKIGIFFLIVTILLAATVLLMHVHYSIDVFSAFFITYGVYIFGERLFKKMNSY